MLRDQLLPPPAGPRIEAHKGSIKPPLRSSGTWLDLGIGTKSEIRYIFRLSAFVLDLSARYCNLKLSVKMIGIRSRALHNLVQTPQITQQNNRYDFLHYLI
ncbi:hypothetical protein KIL84_016369 [Mauremys mutica]|uniref:Uncharacterized protein n=1 Tax=Mauremys mutica TaxID=74926 RepID=A0A9D4AXP5_9SAUR|nr:hypothetical protein KIL84_016369 [Mauremys mutica]